MKKNSSTSSTKEGEKEKYKNNLVKFLILLIGIISLILLSINFVTNYKSISVSKADTHFINNPEQIQEVKQSEHSKLEASLSKNSDKNYEKVQVVTKIEDKCYDYLTLIKEIYNLRPIIEKGEDYSYIMTLISQYKIDNNMLIDNLAILNNNSSHNKPKDYYLNHFRSLIKSLYIENNHSNYKIINFFNNLFFIRTIAERAIEKGGIDMEIYESEQALIKYDFAKALQHLKNINSKLEDFNQFKEQLLSKVNIEFSLLQSEKLLLEKIDCSIVSK